MSVHDNSRRLVFLLEDEALIALDLQDALQDEGFRVAGPFTTCGSALEWLQANTPDAAILDATLKDGPCRDIALELSRRDVPFLIYSGHHEDRELLAEFHHLAWIEKPVPPAMLVQVCKQLLVGCDQAALKN